MSIIKGVGRGGERRWADNDLAKEELHALARIALALGLTREQLEKGLDVLSPD